MRLHLSECFLLSVLYYSPLNYVYISRMACLQEILAALLWLNKFSKTIIGFKRLIHSTLIKRGTKEGKRSVKEEREKKEGRGCETNKMLVLLHEVAPSCR